MNSLVVFPNEVDGKRVVLTGERAMYFHEFHAGSVGHSLPASLWGGGRGRAIVCSSTPAIIELEISVDEPPLPREPVTLVVAVPRPQSLKKVLQFATLAGAARVCFVRADNVERSYMSSKELQPERAQGEMVKALEQCFDSIAPELEKYYSLHACLEKVCMQSSRKLVAHTSPTARPLSQIGALGPQEEVILAVGCEAGWSPGEIELFERHDFIPISLGPRILRVDSATAMLLSQVKLLRDISSVRS